MTTRGHVPAARASRSFVTIGLPHLRRIVVVRSHHNGCCALPPIDTALSPTTRAYPLTAASTLASATRPRAPPCIHTSKRPLSRISAEESSTASTKAKSNARNTTARQIPTALPQRTKNEPQPREQNLWRTIIRRRQEAHGHEEIPQHDESGGHIFALVSKQPRNPSLDNNGSPHQLIIACHSPANHTHHRASSSASQEQHGG